VKTLIILDLKINKENSLVINLHEVEKLQFYKDKSAVNSQHNGEQV